MKHLKRYNEELNPSTYTSAAAKLRQLGHVRRPKELEDWSNFEKERLKKQQQLFRKDELSQFSPFKLKFYKQRWNSATRITEEDFLGEGLFYVEPSFSSDWFGDMMYDHEADGEGLSIPFEFGTSPANEETEIAWEEIKSKCQSLKEQEYDGVTYNTRMWIKLFVPDSYVITNENKCFWETADNGLFVLDSRAEAIRFKKLIIDSLEGKNQWGKNKWHPEGMYGNFIKFFQRDLEWRVKEREAGRNKLEQYFKQEHMPILANKVKMGLSINDLYRS
jgi:hypothetical protein